MTALCIALAFAWVVPEERMRAAVEFDAAYLLTKYVLPLVLLVVIGLRVGLGFSAAGWHVLPGVEAMRANGLIAVGALLALAGVGVALTRIRRSRRQRRSQSKR